MEDQWVEKTSEQSPVTAPMKGPMLQRDSWMMAPPDGGFLPMTSRDELRAKAKQEADEQQKEKNLLDGVIILFNQPKSGVNVFLQNCIRTLIICYTRGYITVFT